MTNRWRYALGEFALSLPGNALNAFLFFYYTDNLGLAVWYASLARIIYTIWDGVNDPLFGHLSDRTRTRWGRRRPWLMVTVPLFLVFTVLAWSPPGGIEGMPLFWYFLAMLIGFETISTMSWINYNTLLPELFVGDEARLKANAARKLLGTVSLVLGIGATPVLAGQLGYPLTGLIWAATGAVAVIFCLTSIREREAEPDRGPGLWTSLKEALSYVRYRYFVVVHACIQIALTMLMAGMPFYAKYTLGLSDGATSVLFAAVFVPALPGMWLWAWVGQVIGTRRAWALALLLFAASTLPLLVVGTLTAGVISAALMGLAMAGCNVTHDVVLSGVIDEDSARTGVRREGIFFSVIWLFARVAGVLQAVSWVLLDVLFGYVSGDSPGPNPGAAFRFLMVVIPGTALALGGVAALMHNRYRGKAAAPAARAAQVR